MKRTQKPHIGIWIGASIILLWALMLAFNLGTEVELISIWTILRIIVQTHLFTGLFITAHDAMHGTVAPKNPKLNHAIGRIATFLFVFNSYKTLRPKHYEHHKHVGTDHDPDFHKGNPHFFLWFWDFVREYVTWWQILLAAITFNLAKLILPQENLILFWIIPSLLSLIQLFYFGTYIPHRGMHDNKHHSSTQQKNHVWAFLTCYFFGYHYEHHDSPVTPWWRLWRMKEVGNSPRQEIL